MVTTNRPSLPPRLENPPEAKAFQIDTLLRRVRDGDVRVPSFQRGLKWDDADRLDLFDSLYRGYPIGTLLLWQREAPAAKVVLGGFAMEAPARTRALWVVDGQQRVTTLAETLLVAALVGKKAIHFDLEEARFYYTPARPPTADPERPRLPLSVVLDSSSLIGWLLAHPFIAEPLRGVAVDVGKRIREYQVPSYIVETSNDQVLRTIFGRTNRSGKRLEESDVFHALFGSLSEDEPSNLRQLAQRSVDLGFGTLDDRAVLNALRAVQGIDFRADLSDAFTQAAVPAALRATDAALRETLSFLRSDAGIPHVDLLPYALPISVLSKFFSMFPVPRERSRLLLRRWLWRGSLGARLTGATVGMRQHLDCVEAGDEERSVQQLLKLSGTEPTEDILALDRFQFQTARTTLQCGALASFGPRDLATGEPLDIPALLSIDREDKVQPILRGKGSEAPYTRGLSNRILHPRLASRDLLEKIAALEDERVLASHVISVASRDALRRKDITSFLSLREEELRRRIARYFERQAEWNADDSPSLESMVIEE